MPTPATTTVVTTRLIRVLGTCRRIGRSLTSREAASPTATAATSTTASTTASEPATSASETRSTASPTLRPHARGRGNVVVHAVPSVLAPAAESRTAAATLGSRRHIPRHHVLTLVLLLLEHHLLLGIESRALTSVTSGAGTTATHGTGTALTAALTARPAHLLLHLLHHLRVHATRSRTSAAATHTSSTAHHSRIHTCAAAHPASLSHSHLLLHHSKILLHAAPILRHHSRGHAVLATRATSTHRHSIRVSAKVPTPATTTMVSTTPTTSASKLPSPPTTSSPSLTIINVPPRLRPLHLNKLIVQIQRIFERAIDCSLRVEGHETETARAVGVFVHHESGIEHTAELLEEGFEIRVGGVLAHAADENFGGAFLLFAGDGAFGIDLRGFLLVGLEAGGWGRLTILPSRVCSLTMTTLTSLGFLKVRNPKPRERPVAPSRMTVHSSTSPNWEK